MLVAPVIVVVVGYTYITYGCYSASIIIPRVVQAGPGCKCQHSFVRFNRRVDVGRVRLGMRENPEEKRRVERKWRRR